MKLHPLILGLETATMAGSLCLARGEDILAGITGDASMSHSNTLLRDIDQVLKNSGTRLRDIDLFAVAVGPGSFTGLRIGLATTKALASTLLRPCVAVPTLAAVAATLGREGKVIASLPAGRGEVFAQLFSVALGGVVSPLDEAAHIAPQNMLRRYETIEPANWAGEGAALHRELICEYAAHHSLHWSIVPIDRQLAQQVVRIGLRLYLEEKTMAAESLQAIYVRPSDAEINVNVLRS